MDKFIIKNGKVCDGISDNIIQSDILIEAGKIKDIAPFIEADDIEKFDAAGKIVAPGFIDAHSHSELRKIKYPENRTKIMQGVTTEVDGHCGISGNCFAYDDGIFKWKDFTEYIELLNKTRPSVNSVFLVGHNDLRKSVMGLKNALPTADELKMMQKKLRYLLNCGAAGFSSGLTYFPGKFADTEELKQLTSVMHGTEKIYTSHIRNEGDDILNAADEAFAIAEAGSGRFQFSHMKTMFQRNWYKIDALLEKIAAAQKNGLDVTADRYPYVYSATGLHQILPPPFDKNDKISAYLKESELHQAEVEAALKNSPRDLSSTILANYGKTIGELAQEMNVSVEHAAMKCLMENNIQRAAYLAMSAENLEKILALPYVCAGSDGISSQLDNKDDFVHPRAAGTFPTFFRLVSKTCSTAEAVRKMTSLPAQIYRIPQRGALKKGYFADIVIFDADKFDSKAAYDGTNQFPLGIDKVFVNGKLAYDSQNPAQINRHGEYIPIK